VYVHWLLHAYFIPIPRHGFFFALVNTPSRKHAIPIHTYSIDKKKTSHKNKTNCEQGVCHHVAYPFTLKSILRQKKNYGNLNISPCKNIILKKNPLKETKILQDIITL
jgi:hypothetical protein